ncbi:hypothetical protein BH24PSE2_BH24PSE2_23250 [soil metagenome]
MPFSIGGRVFRPTLLPTLGLAVLLPFLVALGIWQLDRAAQKRELFAQFELQSARTIDLNRTHEIDPEAARYSGLRATGSYDAAHQFLLDGMSHAGRPGYHVLTPLQLSGDTRAVIVNRGWVPLGASREQLPVVSVPEDLRDITGRIDLPPRAGLRLGESVATSSWPQVVLYPMIEELEERLGFSLEPFFVLLAPDAEDGFVREWRPRVPGPAMHIGYAVQWFALALAVLIIYAVVNLKKVDDGRA